VDKLEHGRRDLRRKAMPRRARLESPEILHHVMVRGIEKRLIVDDETDREARLY
jgi:hypothetical protein